MSEASDTFETPVWGLHAIGEVIGRNKRQTHHLIKSGALDGAVRQFGKLWAGDPVALRKLIIPQQMRGPFHHRLNTSDQRAT